MTTSEKVAYLKGLAEGMGIQEDGGQGKLFHVIIDILEDLSLDLADTKDALVDLTDGVEEISDDLAELENEFYESPCSCCGSDDDEDEEYDDEDEDDTVFYSVECPGCGFKLTVDAPPGTVSSVPLSLSRLWTPRRRCSRLSLSTSRNSRARRGLR